MFNKNKQRCASVNPTSRRPPRAHSIPAETNAGKTEENNSQTALAESMEGEIEQGEVASSQPKDVLDCRSVDDESSLFPVNTEASTNKKKDEISNTPAVFRANDRIHTDLTKARKRALDLIGHLCKVYKLDEALKDKIKEQFNRTTPMGSQSFTARACAALLSVAHQHIDGTDKQLLTNKQITLSDVATRAKILPEKILKVQHQMEKLIPTAKKEAAHKGALLGVGAIPLPEFQVIDAVAGDIGQKIRKIAGDIIRVVVQELNEGEHWNSHFAPIAAACLSYQSFFLHEKDQKGENSRELRFVTIVGQIENLKIIHKYALLIQTALLRVGDHLLNQGILKKVPKSESNKRFVLRNLQEILNQDKEVFRLVVDQLNAERQEELTYEDDSSSEEEFTKEDQEKLMTMELGEEDLSEAEFESMKLLPDAQAFIAEHVLTVMEKYEEERASKKRKRTKQGNVGTPDDEMEEDDSDDGGVY